MNKPLFFKFIAVFLSSMFFAVSASAEEIRGEVVGVDGTRVKIKYESDVAPRNGDTVRIGIEASGQFIRVSGNWVVVSADTEFIWAESNTAGSGTPAVGYIAIVESQNPRPKSELVGGDEQPDTVYIPSLNARVVRMRFFESDNEAPPAGDRVYRTQFRQSTTRKIWWELTLEYPEISQRIDFEITGIWYTSNGNEDHRHKFEFFLDPEENNILYSVSRGWNEPGRR